MKTLILSFITFLSISSAFATIPWRARVACDGPSGQAVYDDFVFTYYGNPVFQQQFVIRNPEIIEYFYKRGIVIPEIGKNFPNEIIIDLYRDQNDYSEFPKRLARTVGAFTYVLEINLPEVRISAYHRATNYLAADWIFRECLPKRTGF
jgi:hypothetical protein